MAEVNGRRITMLVYNDLVHDARVFKEATALQRAGYSLHVIGMCAPESGELTGWEGIRTTRLRVGPFRSLRARYAFFWRRAYRALMNDKPDAVHAHDLDVLVPAFAAARRLGVPLIHDAHELWVELPSVVERPVIRGVWSLLARNLIPRCDALITVSNGLAQEHERRYGVTPIVVRNIPDVASRPRPGNLRERLGIGPAVPIVLFQGGLLPGLGIDRAVAAMEYLPDAHFVIIGGGPLKNEVEQVVHDSAARERITMLSPVPFAELPPITAACDVGLHLGGSRGLNVQYGLPNKVFEYIVAGVPSVVTDWPEQGALVREYGVGLPVPPDASAQVIAAAIREVLTHRETYSRDCVEAARELTWERESAHLLSVYEHFRWRNT